MTLLILVLSFVVAPLVALLVLLRSEGILRFQKKAKYPPSLQSNHHAGDAGWIETIIGLIGPRAPFFAHEGFKKLPKGYPWILTGNFPNKSPSGYGYVVADLSIAKEVLSSPHSQKSIMYEGVDYLTCGYSNIFTANGHRWKHARKNIAPAFSTNHIKRMVRICAGHLDAFMKGTLEECAEKGTSFNIGKEMIHLTLSIISEAAFEYEMTRDEMAEFTTNLETAAECFVIMNPLHQKFPYLFPAVWKANRAAKVVQSIAFRMMANYRKKHGAELKELKTSKSPDYKYEDDTIISRIMNNVNYTCDEERAADIAIFLAAGHDTTAYSIAWTLLEISRNRPPELAAYRKKIADSKLPPEEWKRVDELQYMIKEGMRLQPVLAMGTVRDVGKEISYQQGTEKVTLPKDSIYFINLFPLFRNPLYYDDPNVYRPSRWIAPKTEAAQIPFSIGSRNCIGQNLANAELHTVLAVLCAKYDFEVESEGHPEYLTTLKPVNTLLIPKKLF